MIDGGLRGLFHQYLRVGAHWQAVETGGTGLGIPDSNVCFLMPDGTGRECWIEYKTTDAWSVGVRPEQNSWHRTRIARGGRTFFAVRRCHDGGPRKGDAVDELWMCHGKYSTHLMVEGLQAPDIYWLGVWSGGPARWDWDRVRQILTTAP